MQNFPDPMNPLNIDITRLSLNLSLVCVLLYFIYEHTEGFTALPSNTTVSDIQTLVFLGGCLYGANTAPFVRRAAAVNNNVNEQQGNVNPGHLNQNANNNANQDNIPQQNINPDNLNNNINQGNLNQNANNHANEENMHNRVHNATVSFLSKVGKSILF